MLPLWKRIDHLATSTQSAVTVDEIKELKRVYLMRMEELQLLAEAEEAEEFSDADFARCMSRLKNGLSVGLGADVFLLISRFDGSQSPHNCSAKAT